MESAGGSSFLRSRRLESCFNARSLSSAAESSKVKLREAGVPKPKSDVFVDDNSWIAIVISCIKIVACFVTMMFTTFLWALIMLLLLPWPYARIRQGNVYGHVTGRLLLWILGNPIKIEGAEFSKARAIYVSNHASPIDIFLIMWLTPTGTVGIAKKEIIWYPLFGQLYVLANHLRIDRSNPSSAIDSLKKAACAIVGNNLSLIIFPEGTRSKNGRLLPFKKVIRLYSHGIAISSPNCSNGSDRDTPSVRKNSLHIRPAPLTVKFLPPIRTEDWTADKIDDYINMVHDIYVKHLPEAQRPPVSEAENRERDQTRS